MGYEQDRQDAQTKEQRRTDTIAYDGLDTEAAELIASIQTWHDRGQDLCTVSTNNPSDTADMNNMRTRLQQGIDAILAVAFTETGAASR